MQLHYITYILASTFVPLVYLHPCSFTFQPSCVWISLPLRLSASVPSSRVLLSVFTLLHIHLSVYTHLCIIIIWVFTSVHFYICFFHRSLELFVSTCIYPIIFVYTRFFLSFRDNMTNFRGTASEIGSLANLTVVAMDLERYYVLYVVVNHTWLLSMDTAYWMRMKSYGIWVFRVGILKEIDEKIV